jgi:hypothetical protein
VNPINYNMLYEQGGTTGPNPRAKPSLRLGPKTWANLVDIPLATPRHVRQVRVRCLSNGVVVGILGLTAIVDR